MATRETELPGVGTKHSFDLESGEELVIVEHRAGRWELARVDAEGNTTPVLQLQPKEASELGRILLCGEIVQEDPRKQLLFEQIGIEWATLEADSPLVGRSLQESQIRVRTGANVIAVLRGAACGPQARKHSVSAQFDHGSHSDPLGLRKHSTRYGHVLRCASNRLEQGDLLRAFSTGNRAGNHLPELRVNVVE